MQTFTLLFVLGTALSCVFAAPKYGPTENLSDDYFNAGPEFSAYYVKVGNDIKAKANELLRSDEDNESPIDRHESPIAMSYRKQEVVEDGGESGTLYYIKTRLGDYIFHVKLLQNSNYDLIVEGVKGPVGESDPIESFDLDVEPEWHSSFNYISKL